MIKEKKDRDFSQIKNKKSSNKKIAIVGIVVIVLLVGSIGFLGNNPAKESFSGKGVSFEYIKGWDFSNGTLDDELLSGSYNKIVFSLYKSPTTDNITQIVNDELTVANMMSSTVSEEDWISIDNETAFYYASDLNNLQSKTYIFVKDNYEYKLIFTGDTFSYRRSIDTIVNSFHAN